MARENRISKSVYLYIFREEEEFAMTRYDEQFYHDVHQLVQTFKEIAKDIHEIKEHIVPKPMPIEIQVQPKTFTYGEICKMKDDFEEIKQWTDRGDKERNDK